MDGLEWRLTLYWTGCSRGEEDRMRLMDFGGEVVEIGFSREGIQGMGRNNNRCGEGWAGESRSEWLRLSGETAKRMRQ